MATRELGESDTKLGKTREQRTGRCGEAALRRRLRRGREERHSQRRETPDRLN